jgi:hypothetical protein
MTTIAELAHPWLIGTVLAVDGGTYNVTRPHELVVTNSSSGTVTWTVNLLTSTNRVDGAYLYVSDWDSIGGVTLVADKSMYVPGLGSGTSLTLAVGTFVGLVFVAAADRWIPISYYKLP